MVKPLWQPSEERLARSNLKAFMAFLEARGEAGADDYAGLHRWSIDEPGAFWSSVWDFCEVVGERADGPAVLHLERMPGALWFPGARLNFAENLLRRRDDAPALLFRGEGRPLRMLSHAQLAARVSQLMQTLRGWGVEPGDRVAGYVANVPEALIAMLAATGLGAVWSSCSPDFGVSGVVDRFGQIEPKVLFAVDGYPYAGKAHDCSARIAEIRAAIPSIERTVRIPYLHDAGDSLDASDLDGTIAFSAALALHAPEPLAFECFAFDHPLYIVYSSGTTGRPKCIVHGAGGTLIQHLKEHRLHVDLKPDDRLFYFTTCGWMMWNWLVSGLASEATLVLYDGSPFHPDGNTLFDLADEARVNVFGTSAKFIDAAAKAGLVPAETHDLSSLNAILSTGSPLAAESFDYVYGSIKRDVCLSSISGGTDILSCFVGGNPIGPVWRGEIQAACLGMKVEVFDERGQSLRGEKGELVCTQPFPAMPLGFFEDEGGERYHAAYFERFAGAWCQGDFAEVSEHDGFVIHGRSDAVLNPGGVRIGTAEVYRQVEQVDEVVESLVIGQEWQGDVRVVLFVRLRDGCHLDDSLRGRIREQVRRNATPRHVPARIVEVADIPRTKSGKIVELAVRSIVHGRPVVNRDALANPEALELFAGLAELES